MPDYLLQLFILHVLSGHLQEWSGFLSLLYHM